MVLDFLRFARPRRQETAESRQAMAEFECKVADSTGRTFLQIEAAQSETEARQRLTDRGFYVFSVRPRLALLAGKISARRGLAEGSTDFLIFNQQFVTLIKAGLPILRALDLLAERAAVPRLRPLLRDIRDRVREGALLSEAMAESGAFPRVYTTSILAGERSGNLSGVLDSYIAFQRVTTSFRRRLLASLIYPAILLTVAILIVTYVVGYVIPQFSRLYAELNVTVPATTQILISLATGFRGPILAFTAILVLAGIGAAFWTRSEQGARAFDRIKMVMPVLGVIWVKYHVAQLMRTLSTLLAGGTPLVTALETSAGAAGSRLLTDAVLAAAQRVREGSSLHDGLAEAKFIPDLALEMIEVGEATGALSPMLLSVAEFYEEDVNLRLATILNIAQPVIIVTLALVVLFILVSLYVPVLTFSISTTVR
jgi:type IV pilus assembly protein PilC